MAQETWTNDDVQGFAGQLAGFYESLSPAERQIFADMLSDDVRGSDEVAGYLSSEQPLPVQAVTAAVSEYLLTQTAE